MSSCPTCAVNLLISCALAGAVFLGCASAWLRERRRPRPLP